jgi:hypothetical protein
VSRIKYKQRKKGATKKFAEKNIRSDVSYGPSELNSGFHIFYYSACPICKEVNIRCGTAFPKIVLIIVKKL